MQTVGLNVGQSWHMVTTATLPFSFHYQKTIVPGIFSPGKHLVKLTDPMLAGTILAGYLYFAPVLSENLAGQYTLSEKGISAIFEEYYFCDAPADWRIILWNRPRVSIANIQVWRAS